MSWLVQRDFPQGELISLALLGAQLFLCLAQSQLIVLQVIRLIATGA
jgi:hypothetical protein